MPVVEPYFGIYPNPQEPVIVRYWNGFSKTRLPILRAEMKRRLASMDPLERAKLQTRLAESDARIRQAQMAIEQARTAGELKNQSELIAALGRIRAAATTGEYNLLEQESENFTRLLVEQLGADVAMAEAGIPEDDAKKAVDIALENRRSQMDINRKNLEAGVQVKGRSPEETFRIAEQNAENRFRESVSATLGEVDDAAKPTLLEHVESGLTGVLGGMGALGEGQVEVEVGRILSGIEPGSPKTPELDPSRVTGYGAGRPADPVQGFLGDLTAAGIDPSEIGQTGTTTRTKTGYRGPQSGVPAELGGEGIDAGQYVEGGPVYQAPPAQYQTSAAPPASQATQAALASLARTGVDPTLDPTQPQPWDYYYRQILGRRDPQREARAARAMRMMESPEGRAQLESMMNAWRAANPREARRAVRGVERGQREVQRGFAEEYMEDIGGGEPVVTRAPEGRFMPDRYPDRAAAQRDLDAFISQQIDRALATNDPAVVEAVQDRMINIVDDFRTTWDAEEMRAGEEEMLNIQRSEIEIEGDVDTPYMEGYREEAAPIGVEARLDPVTADRVAYIERMEKEQPFWFNAFLGEMSEEYNAAGPERRAVMRTLLADRLPEDRPEVSQLDEPVPVEKPEGFDAEQYISPDVVAAEYSPDVFNDKESAGSALSSRLNSMIDEAAASGDVDSAIATAEEIQSEFVKRWAGIEKPARGSGEYTPKPEVIERVAQMFGPEKFKSREESFNAMMDYAARAKLGEEAQQKLLSAVIEAFPEGTKWPAEAEAERAARREAEVAEERMASGAIEASIAEEQGFRLRIPDTPEELEGGIEAIGADQYMEQLDETPEKQMMEAKEEWKRQKQEEERRITGRPEENIADTIQADAAMSVSDMPEIKPAALEVEDEDDDEEEEDYVGASGASYEG